MRVYILAFLFLLSSFHLFSQECPQPTGLYVDNYTFNSSYASVNANWESLLGTGVHHFIVNYKHVDSLQWNNLANLDSTSTYKIIGLLDFNSTYVWRIAAYCSENNSVASEISVVDTFTTSMYVDCPLPINTYHDNIIVTEQDAFVDVHWDSMLDLGIDHFIIGYKKLEDSTWNNLQGMDYTFVSNTIGGGDNLEHETSYEWWVQAYCSENQSYYSDRSAIDTFNIGSFVPQEFTPEIEIELSSLLCEDYTDINFVLEQGLNEPDIQSTKVTSNLGSIDLENLEIGQNVGNAIVTAGINDFINNEYVLEVSEVFIDDNFVEIDLINEGETQYSINIINLEDGGVEISIVSPTDGNSYTSGNSLDISLTGIFINPSPSLMQFDVVIFSELNNDTFDQFDFDIECETNNIDIFEKTPLLYPNPTSSTLNVMLGDMASIRILDVTGQLIYSDDTPSNSINISPLPKGLYFVEIFSQGKRIVESLIVR